MRERLVTQSIIRGTVRPPGDKSISHRALIFNGITHGKVLIENVSVGTDVNSTIRCIRELGSENASSPLDFKRDLISINAISCSSVQTKGVALPLIFAVVPKCAGGVEKTVYKNRHYLCKILTECGL